MAQEFKLQFPLLNREAQVKKSAYSHVILREGLYSVSVDKLPLTEYFVFFNSPLKSEQLKFKFYKTSEGKWYDKAYSEEAELNTPEFGLPEMNNELKATIDAFESEHAKLEKITN